MGLMRLLLIVLLAGLALPAMPAAAQTGAPVPGTGAPGTGAPVPGPCRRFPESTGAIQLICRPAEGWNGELIVYAHGYVAFNEPLDFHQLTLPDGTYVPTLLQQLGFAFATSSYRQ